MTKSAEARTDNHEVLDVDIADPVSLLNFLFGGGLAPVAPLPDCGMTDLPDDKELGCESSPQC